MSRVRFYLEHRRPNAVIFREAWPWEPRYDRRPAKVDSEITVAERVDLLVKASALIVAEIERLERLKK